MRALRKRLACAEGVCEAFSSACAWASIARVPIPKSSLLSQWLISFWLSFYSFSGIRERREPFTRQNQILPKELVTVGQIDNVIALRTSHFLFVHAGELFFNVAERKKENKREDEEELEGQNKKGHTERKDQ